MLFVYLEESKYTVVLYVEEVTGLYSQYRIFSNMTSPIRYTCIWKIGSLEDSVHF